MSEQVFCIMGWLDEELQWSGEVETTRGRVTLVPLDWMEDLGEFETIPFVFAWLPFRKDDLFSESIIRCRRLKRLPLLLSLLVLLRL